MKNYELLDQIIVGRVTPHIYAFVTNTIPNYLKVGDTYRPVAMRLKEWSKYFPDLRKQFEEKATITDDVYFRDFAIHYYLENHLNKERLLPEILDQDVYFSKEFFKDTTSLHIKEAIDDIKARYEDVSSPYSYYDANKRLAITLHYERGEEWALRPNQKDAVETFFKSG